MIATALYRSAPIFAPGSSRPMCHCATLAELPGGDVMAAWFGGSFETAPDQAIFGARCKPRDSHWTPPVVLADTPDHADGQPVLFVHPGGSLWLFFVTIAGRDWKTARLKLQKSPD